MNKNISKLNTIMIQLAVLHEKVDTIHKQLERIEELEEKVEELEKFRAYTKGAAVVSIAGLTTLAGTILSYLENLWG